MKEIRVCEIRADAAAAGAAKVLKLEGIPGYGAALIIFFKVLLLSPIRHYFPDCRAVERTGAWQRPSGI